MDKDTDYCTSVFVLSSTEITDIYDSLGGFKRGQCTLMDMSDM